MRLPVVEHPERYVGLYVFDFGTHVSIGYTASEIELLRQAASHREGTAYEIYRIDDSGRYELRGACDERLAAQEALCFLHADLTAARSDYDRLTAHAAQHPVPCAAEVILARIAAFDPPGVAAVTYPGVSFDVLVDKCSRDHGPAAARKTPVAARVGFSNNLDALADVFSSSGYAPFDDSEALTAGALVSS